MVLSTLGDPRGRRGRRHELATVLILALAGVVAGARSLAGIAGWASDLPRWAWPRLGVVRRPPNLATIRRVLLLVDPDVTSMTSGPLASAPRSGVRSPASAHALARARRGRC